MTRTNTNCTTNAIQFTQVQFLPTPFFDCNSIISLVIPSSKCGLVDTLVVQPCGYMYCLRYFFIAL